MELSGPKIKKILILSPKNTFFVFREMQLVSKAINFRSEFSEPKKFLIFFLKNCYILLNGFF